MTLTERLLAEMEQEATSTHKMLERVPTDQWNWRPHEKSMSIKELAVHIANLAGMPSVVIKQPYLDFADGSLKTPEINTNEDLIKFLETGTKHAEEALKATNDEALNEKWTMKYGDHIIMEASKADVIRKMALNHLYHHRAQLSVYLRLLNIPIPGMYGPSADDKA